MADLGRHFGGHLYEHEARYLMREEWAELRLRVGKRVREFNRAECGPFTRLADVLQAARA